MLWLGEAEGAFKVLCCRSPFSCQAAQSGGTQPSLSGLNQLSHASLYHYNIERLRAAELVELVYRLKIKVYLILV